MNEGIREKELQLELAELRNPYLQKEFRDHEVRCTGVSSEEARRRRLRARQRKRKRALRRRAIKVCVFLLVFVLLLCFLLKLFHGGLSDKGGAGFADSEKITQAVNMQIEHPAWTVDYLTPNEYSRPQDALGTVTNIFVHYTANKDTSAAQNRSYFEQLKDTHERSASAHFIIGYEGEIIQCIPLDEIAYAVQTRNYDSISIECCYLEEDGSFTKETEDSLIELLAYLLQTYNLTTEDILRHYDCGGKRCPLYYVEHEEAWEELKAKVAEKLGETL
ncbi:MAG: N-acetylmuramoyl-L-alanine amidase family protein [Lachnospiraceae bacterium]